MFSKEKRFLMFLALMTLVFAVLGWQFGVGFAKGPKTEADALRNAIEIRRYLEENLGNEEEIEKVIKEAKRMGKKNNLTVAVFQNLNNLQQPQYDVKICWDLDGKSVYIADFSIVTK